MEYIPRKLSTELIKWLERKEILAIRGPRQSGKTTLLEYLSTYIRENINISPKNIISISFEDKNLVSNFSKDPKSFIESYIVPEKQNRHYFLLDEFQYIKDGGQKFMIQLKMQNL